MKFADLQKALEPTAGTLRVNGGQLQSAHIASLLGDFLPDGVFYVQTAAAKLGKLPLDGHEIDAVNVAGRLVPAFLGATGLTIDAWFFLSSDSAEFIATIKGVPDPWRLSTGFPTTAGSEAEHALFYNCIFALDSRQPHLLGPDFNAIFHPDNSDDEQQSPVNTPVKPSDAKRGLSLTADLALLSIDETLSDLLKLRSNRLANRLAVSGPIEIADGGPRARFRTTEHVAKFSFPNSEFDLDYEFLTAPVLEGANMIQKARERLTTKLEYQSEQKPVVLPLAVTFDPESLTESVVIESNFGSSSPLSVETLASLLPDTIPALPKNFPVLKDLALTDLSLEIDPQSPALKSVHVRVEVPDHFTIVPDLVTFGGLKLDLTASKYGHQWQWWPYVSGDLTLAGGKLSGIFDISAKTFYCALNDYEVVDLKKLFEETLKLGDLLPARDKFDLIRFEVSGDFAANVYSLDIATSIDWPLDLGVTTIGIKNLFLTLEYADGQPTGSLGGSLAIGGVTAGIAAAYDPTGLTFEMAAYNIRLTDLLASVLGDPKLAQELPDVEFPALQFTFTPKTGAFKFHSVADLSWNQPFGTEAKFDCKMDLTLERAARLTTSGVTANKDQLKAPPVTCIIAIDGQGSTIINGKEFDATINVLATNQTTGVDGKKALDITAGGSLRVRLDSGDVSFGLVFHSGAESKRITATWPASDQKSKDAVLDFKALGSKLGLNLKDVPDELIPTLKEVTFSYDFAVSQLLLAAETEHTKLVFLTANLPSDGTTANGGGDKGKSTPTRLYAFILDIELSVTLAELPLIGQKLASFANMGVEGLRVSVISQPLTTKQIQAFDDTITHADPTLPTLPWSADPNLPLPKGGLIQLRVRTGDAQKPPLTFRVGAGSGNDNTTVRQPIGTGGNVSGPGINGTQPGVVPSTVPGVSWLNIQRSFGPVNIKRIGAAYSNGDIKLALDAGFALSAVSLDLLGLTLEFPIRSFSIDKLRPDLHGIAMSYQSGAVSISGGFLEVDPPPPGLKFEYNGQAQVLAASFGLSAIGSFAEFTDGKPSLFVFAALNAPIGGPPFFFVTGVAAGFGYNRSLTLPQLGALPSFPLVAAAMPTPANPDPFAGPAGADPTTALAVMDKYVSPAYGENWLAAGIKFTSFKVLESFALLTVSFGTRFEVAMLGLTALAMPAGVPEPIGFAELAVEVVFAPDDGVLMVAAQLTPESYILSRDCHLTGGFAFYIWFKDNPRSGAKAGEFVVTLGGYNPHFAVPAYYPSEPRVGANWQVSDKLSVKGGLYFALTPSVVMAGGFLQANFQSGDLRAWFDAEADFLLTWKPFHYEAWIGLHIGASYRVGSGVTSFVIEVHVGADVHLWGPKFAGTAEVDLYVCSFTINFGDAAQQTVPLLPWSEFRESFLPPVMAGRDAQKRAAHHAETHARAFAFAASNGVVHAMAATPPTPTDSYCLLRLTGGLVRDLTGEKKAETNIDYVVNPEKFAVTTASVFPCTSVVLITGDGKTSYNCKFAASPFGVAPVGINNGDLESVHTVRFHQVDKSGQPLRDFNAKSSWIQPVYGELPRAAWYKEPATDSTRTPTVEQLNGRRTVSGALTGTNIQPPAPTYDQTAAIEIATLLYADEEPNHLRKTFFNPLYAPAKDSFDQTTAWDQLRQINSITAPDGDNRGHGSGPATARGKVIAALLRQNIMVRDASTVNTDYFSRAASITEEAVKAGDDVPAPLLCLLGEAKAR
jgi:hypothetical protein